jgi:hypothetical protein
VTVVGIAFLAMLAGCEQPHTRVKRVTLWQGTADCTTCRAGAITLWPNGPAGVTLKVNSTYTAELELEFPRDPDRCIFRFVSGTWELPSHDFVCDPENDVMRRTLGTSRFSMPSGGDVLWVRVDVLSFSERRQLELILDTQRYDVTWIQ